MRNCELSLYDNYATLFSVAFYAKLPMDRLARLIRVRIISRQARKFEIISVGAK
jgi:hypothetical protein